MNIEDEFDKFFEWPTDDKSTVSSVSAKLFAKHCVASLLETNQMLTEHISKIDYEFTEVEMAEHDAEVIKKARSYVVREIDSQQLAEDYDMELCWYINQLRQKAQEAG